MSLREIDALEKMRDVLFQIHKHNNNQLAAASKELEFFKEKAQARGSDVENDIAYHHAVYADELTALMVATTQLSHMSSLSDPEPTTDESDSDMSDDLVYADDDDSDGNPSGGSLDEGWAE